MTYFILTVKLFQKLENIIKTPSSNKLNVISINYNQVNADNKLPILYKKEEKLKKIAPNTIDSEVNKLYYNKEELMNKANTTKSILMNNLNNNKAIKGLKKNASQSPRNIKLLNPFKNVKLPNFIESGSEENKLEIRSDSKIKIEKNKENFLSSVPKQTKKNLIKSFLTKTRAGMNYDGTRKVNQDNFISKINLLEKDDFHIFAVFDGHGMTYFT